MPARSAGQHQGEGHRLPHLTSTLRHLAGTPNETYVAQVLDRSIQPYVEMRIPKRSGGVRVIHSPEDRLMEIQRGFLDSVLNRWTPHASAFAYRPGVSVVECAERHLRADTVVRLDIADFFASVRERHLYQLFRRPPESVSVPTWWHGGHSLTAYQLALLATVAPVSPSTWVNRGTGRQVIGDLIVPRNYVYRHQREGFLPQGAPTSGAISNLVLEEADDHIYRLAAGLGLRYTRYSDDLYFSSRKPVPRRAIDTLIRESREVLASVGFKLNDAKTRVARSGTRRSVLGILVDGRHTRLPRETHRTIELHLRGVDRHGLQAHAEHRGFVSVEALEQHVMGLIGWSRTVDPGRGDEQHAHWERSRKRGRSGSAIELPPSTPQTAAQSAEDQARESIDRLLAGAHAYRRSSDYAEFNSFLGRFHWYSPFNAAMVKLQRPGAKYVATEKAWIEKHRRVLRPGAQPLVIMQPGGPYMVVFDVGDTEALPGAPRLPREVINPLAARSGLDDATAMRLWDITVDNAIRDGIRTTLVHNNPLHAGSARWSRRKGTITRPGPRARGVEEYPLLHEVEVSRHMAPVDRYVTLVHELAHLYCGHLGTPDPSQWPDRRGSKQREEIESESIAYIVMLRHDPTFEMTDYLLGYLRDVGEIPEGVSLRLMMQVVTRIMDMGEKRLSKPSSRRPA
jgi:hypothetical protein